MQHANPNATDGNDHTPLAYALRYRRAPLDLEIVRLLIQHGANLKLKDSEGATPIFYAVDSGSYQAAELLLKAGAPVNEIGDYGSTPLLQAIDRGQIGMVQLLLAHGAQIEAKAHRKPASAQKKEGLESSLAGNASEPNSALTEAASMGKLEILQLLIKQLHRPWKPSVDALGGAAHSNNPAMVRYLLKLGAPVNAVDDQGQTALQQAAMFGYFEVCQALIEGGANPNIADKDGSGPLTSAAIGMGDKTEALVKLLLDHGADPNGGKSNEGDTPLGFAAVQGNLPVVKLLLSHGADPNRYSFLGGPAEGPRPLIFGVLTQGNQLHANMAIWGYGGSITEAQKAEITRKAQDTDAAVVRALLDKGAKIRSGPGRLVLIDAAAGGNLAIVKMLAERGAAVNISDMVRAVPMDPRLKSELDQEIKKDPGKADEIRAKYEQITGAPQGLTPLLAASGKGNSDIVGYLLSKGADVRARDKKGATALMYLAREGRNAIKIHLRSYREGVLHRADEGNPKPTSREVSLREAAIWARWAETGDIATAKALLAAGADANAQAADGSTALMEAAAAGNAPVAKALLDAGANINQADKEGTTALMHVIADGRKAHAAELYSFELDEMAHGSRNLAAKSAQDAQKAQVNQEGVAADMAMMRLLLARGADPELRNFKGKTASEFAEALKYPEASAELTRIKDTRPVPGPPSKQ